MASNDLRPQVDGTWNWEGAPQGQRLITFPCFVNAVSLYSGLVEHLMRVCTHRVRREQKNPMFLR